MLTIESSGLNSSFQKVKVCVVVGLCPKKNNVNGEERERFWNDLDRIVDRVGNGYRLAMLENNG